MQVLNSWKASGLLWLLSEKSRLSGFCIYAYAYEHIHFFAQSQGK